VSGNADVQAQAGDAEASPQGRGNWYDPAARVAGQAFGLWKTGSMLVDGLRSAGQFPADWLFDRDGTRARTADVVDHVLSNPGQVASDAAAGMWESTKRAVTAPVDRDLTAWERGVAGGRLVGNAALAATGVVRPVTRVGSSVSNAVKRRAVGLWTVPRQYEELVSILRARKHVWIPEDEPMLFRGTDTPPGEAFHKGLSPSKHNHHPFPELGQDKSNVYASTSVDPDISRYFRAAYVPADYVYVLRGRDARELHPKYKTVHAFEKEWAMHEIRPEDIAGVMIQDVGGWKWVFLSNPEYRRLPRPLEDD
jgi:hypothetical protein